MSYTVAIPPLSPTAPLRLTPKTPRSAASPFPETPIPVHFAPSTSNGWSPLIHSLQPSPATSGTKKAYKLSVHKVSSPTRPQCDRVTSPLPAELPNDSDAPPRGPTPLLHRHVSYKQLRKAATQLPSSWRGPCAVSANSEVRSTAIGMDETSIETYHTHPYPNSGERSTIRTPSANRHERLLRVPTPQPNENSSSVPSSCYIPMAPKSMHIRSSTAPSPIMIEGAGNLSMKQSIFSARRASVKASTAQSAFREEMQLPLSLAQKMNYSRVDPTIGHPEPQQVVKTPLKTMFQTNLPPSSSMSASDIPITDILTTTDTQQKGELPPTPYIKPRHHHTSSSPVSSINVPLPPRRQNSVFSRDQSSADMINLPPMVDRQHSVGGATVASSTTDQIERRLSELFRSFEKLDETFRSRESSITSYEESRDVKFQVQSVDDDDDSESIITNPEEEEVIMKARLTPKQPEEDTTSLCAPSFLRLETASARSDLKTKRSSAALPQSRFSNTSSSPPSSIAHDLSSSDEGTLACDEEAGDTDIDIFIASKTALPPSPPYIQDEELPTDSNSDPVYLPRYSQVPTSSDQRIEPVVEPSPARHASILSNFVPPITPSLVETPKKATPTLSNLSPTSVSPLKVRPPPRLTSITLPPARPLRSVVRSDLSVEEIQQWDKGKVATDVQQVVQNLQWDKAQKAWQLVKAAETSPMARRKDIPPSLQPGHIHFAPTPTRSMSGLDQPSLILPPGCLEWALIDPGMPGITTESQLVFRLCITWRVHSGINTFRHPFGAQEEVKAFVLGRTYEEFYAFYEGLLERFELEPRRHRWTQAHEMSPRAKACIEYMEPPQAKEYEDDLQRPYGEGWVVNEEQVRRKKETLDAWVQGLMKLKGSNMEYVLASEFVRSWMAPTRIGDCERWANDWRRGSYGYLGSGEAFARTLERAW